MASLTDVMNTLVGLVAPAMYPNGTSQPSAVTVGATNIKVKVYAGWPQAAQLDNDMVAADTAHITVYPRPEEKNTTRFSDDWRQISIAAATLTLTQNGQQITVGGTVATPQNVVVFIGGTPKVYAAQAGDTLTSIATALAALISGATSTGAVVTCPNTAVIGALRVGVSGTSVKEVRRQERRFQVTLWASSPAMRDALSNIVDPLLSILRFVTLPDGTAGRIIYRAQHITDVAQEHRSYRADFIYSVEYGTTVSDAEMTITQTQTNTTANPDGTTQITVGPTVYA